MDPRSGSQSGPAGGSHQGDPTPVRLTEPLVPRQPRRTPRGESGASPGDRAGVRPPLPDPLEQDDVAAVADAVGTENLLRCWLRETPFVRPADGMVRLALEATGVRLRVPLRHWSATGWHRFGPPVPEGAPPHAVPLDAVTLAALLAREAAHRSGGAPVAESAALVGRVADSVRHTAAFLTARRAAPAAPEGTDPFLDGEQSLLLGHPFHPAPKSREGLSEAEAGAYAPELRGAFPLHWMAVHSSVLATDSAWCDADGGDTDGDGDADSRREGAAPVPAPLLAAHLAGPDLAARLPRDTVALPLHPWQAREARHRPEVAALLEAGLLHDLGPFGSPWFPTSSVRTVCRPGTPVMLKLSLGLRITNSRRENLRKEALRGVEVHRLLRAGLGARLRAAHPGFDIVRDPAWLGVDSPCGTPVAGLDTVLRHNPFGPGDQAVCVASLTSLRPLPGVPGTTLRSQLAVTVRRLATRTGRPVAHVAAEWFRRYLDAVVRPVLWLDAHAGIALEAHQQNTLVLLDGDGWPRGGRYRDNQGYYFRASHREAIDRLLPSAGVASDTFVTDALADERFAYYLGVNNLLGLVGAFGAQGLAPEEELLAVLRGFLVNAASGGDGDRAPVSPLPGLLLDAPLLRCKANLFNRLRGMDELVGPVDTQSVYVTVSNPLGR